MMNLIPKIVEKLKISPTSYTILYDLFTISKNLLKTNVRLTVHWLSYCSEHCEKVIPIIVKDDLALARKFMLLHKDILLAAAPHHFDSYIQYVEWNRDPKKKFYKPRRKQLREVVDAIQALADDDLDILAISLPPGVGKTTVAIFGLTWLAGRVPDEPMLMGSHSDSIVRGVYEECLRILDPNGEYLFADVFPNAKVCGTNAKDLRIDMNSRKRFETLEFTSIGSGNAGLYRASTLLYCDDLIKNREVAMSEERLEKLWNIYTTDLRQRKIGDHCKELHIATRWSVRDVIGRLEAEYQGNPRVKFISFPALDENDESLFDYEYGLGYTTEFLHEQRDLMDATDWDALYMNQPMERKGRLYDKDELRRFFSLPTTPPDAIIAICDTKDKGKDFAVLPVGYVYGSDYFISDVICDDSKPEVLDMRMVEILYKNKVQIARFESNSAGGRVAADVEKALKKKGGITSIQTKFTTENKETKIIANSPWVKQHCLFLDESMYKPNSDYGRFMRFLCTWSTAGKNAHDDVPDGMAMFAIFAQSFAGAKVTVTKRPF